MGGPKPLEFCQRSFIPHITYLTSFWKYGWLRSRHRSLVHLPKRLWKPQGQVTRSVFLPSLQSQLGQGRPQSATGRTTEELLPDAPYNSVWAKSSLHSTRSLFFVRLVALLYFLPCLSFSHLYAKVTTWPTANKIWNWKNLTAFRETFKVDEKAS